MSEFSILDNFIQVLSQQCDVTKPSALMTALRCSTRRRCSTLLRKSCTSWAINMALSPYENSGSWNAPMSSASMYQKT